MGVNSSHIINFSQIYKEDEDIVGKKAAELSQLAGIGILIPDGFVITASFFKKFLEQTGISNRISEVQKLDHPAISESVEKLFDPIKKRILHTHIPNNLVSQLYKFYKKLGGRFNDPSLSIFSSSYDNKPIAFKNVKGDSNFILKIKEIWLLHIHHPQAIIIQKNIDSKNTGRLFTNDPLIGDQNLLKIAKEIQKHFYFPKVVDYTIQKNKIYITDILSFTGKAGDLSSQTVSKKIRKVLIKGIPINAGIVTGPVRLFKGNRNRTQIPSGEIIVLPRLDMSTYGKLKKAKAIVAEAVLKNPYEKMMYRENFKIPTIEGTKNAVKILQNGDIITVNGINGEIYRGSFI